MKFGFRKPSLKKSISAKFSVKRKVKNSLGLRMPRGTGWITNPKKSLYNKIYHKTTFGIGDVVKSSKRIKTSEVKKKYQNSDIRISPEKTSTNDSGVNIINWFNTEFSKEERDHMEEIYQPFGIDTGLKEEITGITENSALHILTILSGWFDNPRDRELALKLIKKAEEYIDKGEILDKHFFWSKKMELYYKLRDTDPNALEIAIRSAREQIKLAPDATQAFIKDGLPQLPAHAGYKQLAIILDKQGKYEEAIDLVKQAKSQGWNGDWDKRIERLEVKKAKKSN